MRTRRLPRRDGSILICGLLAWPVLGTSRARTRCRKHLGACAGGGYPNLEHPNYPSCILGIFDMNWAAFPARPNATTVISGPLGSPKSTRQKCRPRFGPLPCAFYTAYARPPPLAGIKPERSRMEDLQHECGVAALYHLPGPKVSPLVPDGDPKKVTRLMPRMLIDLQNRGQLAAGMTSYNPDRDAILQTYKEIGTVIEAFRLSREDKYKKVMAEHEGSAGIGHVRYATCGDNSRGFAQPFERQHGCKWKWFSFAFNGQLANFKQLREDLLALSDYHLK